jgi:protein tyrosine phosphatase (PTP) superfamily phosphohydrolase (DUF442 family)
MRALLLAAGLAAGAAQAQPAFAPPNLVVIGPKLVTSGQPSAESLAALKANGFEAVVSLAPPTVPDAVRDEALIVGRQGIIFVNLPIRGDGPTEADYEAFSGVMRALGSRKVLVHCQVNMRASAFVFLYRAVALHDDPRAAYDAVSRIWSPYEPWKGVMERVLRRNGVAFEIF